MRKFYYSSCSIAAPHVGIILDDMLSTKEREDKIWLAYCHCGLASCFMNLSGHDSICRFCHYMYRNYQKKYGDGITMIPIRETDLVHVKRSFNLHSADDVRAVKYRGVEVGSSILSMYYDISRDLDMKNWDGFFIWALPLMQNLCDLIDYVYILFERLKPDEVLIYNGRLFENRLFYDIARHVGIPFTSLEGVGGHVEPYRRIRFRGELPLSIELYGKMVEKLWNTSPLSIEEKTQQAASFYEKRRNGILVGDTKVYTAMQEEGLLPEDFNPDKKNIAIFNSSQDEIAALGDEWQEDNLFSSQYEAIAFMLENADSTQHFYLRIHPNLKGITHKEHMELYELSKYEHITIIPPESKVSSYALMDACYKVVTFGSTTGVEACYWGKPSILVGRSYYEMTDACYHIKSREQLVKAILSDLSAKPKIGALKYAYFLVDRQYAVEDSMIDIDVKYHHYHWDFFSTSYFKVWNSGLLFQLLFLWNYILRPKFTKGKHPFPWPQR